MDRLVSRVWMKDNARKYTARCNSHDCWLLNAVYSNVKTLAFKAVDSVRVTKFKTIFEKGYTPNRTTDLESSK